MYKKNVMEIILKAWPHLASLNLKTIPPQTNITAIFIPMFH